MGRIGLYRARSSIPTHISREAGSVNSNDGMIGARRATDAAKRATRWLNPGTYHSIEAYQSPAAYRSLGARVIHQPSDWLVEGGRPRGHGRLDEYFTLSSKTAFGVALGVHFDTSRGPLRHEVRFDRSISYRASVPGLEATPRQFWVE